MIMFSDGDFLLLDASSRYRVHWAFGQLISYLHLSPATLESVVKPAFRAVQGTDDTYEDAWLFGLSRQRRGMTIYGNLPYHHAMGPNS